MEPTLPTRYQFVIAETSSRIPFDFVGAMSIDLDVDGALIVRHGQDEQWRPSPRAYQVLNGIDQTVDVHFDLRNKRDVELVVGTHDSARPLVVELVDAHRPQ
jgi:hypothetical protein